MANSDLDGRVQSNCISSFFPIRLSFFANSFPVQCISRSDARGSLPFGLDPTFVVSSSLYNPNANASAVDMLSERAVPYGAKAGGKKGKRRRQ